MPKRLDPIAFPAQLVKTLNQRLYRLEKADLTDKSDFYNQAEEYGLKEKYYNWTMDDNGPKVRALTKRDWNKLTPAEQKKTLKMYEGAVEAKTSTVRGIKAKEDEWKETYMRHNPHLFVDETVARSEAERQRIQSQNEARAEEHKEYFNNFWSQMKDHFQYDAETWSYMMRHYDIQAMIDAGMKPSRMVEIFNLIKAKNKGEHRAHQIPAKYRGTSF